MKKVYQTPAVEITSTMVENMMALSLQSGAADGSEVLGKEEHDWNIWTESAE